MGKAGSIAIHRETSSSRDPETRMEATEALRGLIDAIIMTPDEDALKVELKDNLAAMLGATVQSKRSPDTGDLLVQITLVAGARNPLNFGVCLERCLKGWDRGDYTPHNGVDGRRRREPVPDRRCRSPRRTQHH
jgi:hypothetical protein